MSTNPFENNNSDYFALTNDEGQYSLWPAHLEIPKGWSCQYGPMGKAECLTFIESHWIDMRPLSLISKTTMQLPTKTSEFDPDD
jgi:MbtH protein